MQIAPIPVAQPVAVVVTGMLCQATMHHVIHTLVVLFRLLHIAAHAVVVQGSVPMTIQVEPIWIFKPSALEVAVVAIGIKRTKINVANTLEELWTLTPTAVHVVEEHNRLRLQSTTNRHVLTLTTVLLTQMVIIALPMQQVTGITLVILSVMEQMMVHQDSQHKHIAALVVVDVFLRALDTIV